LGDKVKGDLTEHIALAQAPVDFWSTNSVPERERYSYWRDAVCRAAFNLTIEAVPERFSARITGRGTDQLRFATSESTAYRIVRNRADISSAPSDHYSIYMHLHGPNIINRGDETVTFQPNDIAIADLRRPFSVDVAEGARAIAVIPRAMLDRRAPWLRHTALSKIAADTPFADLARRHLLELTGANSVLSNTEMSLLGENLCNLLALATSTDVAPSALQPELQMEALLAFCRGNLHDADLSPQMAADHLGISLRTLHLRFKQIGQTFGRFVLESRLEACRAALRDQNQHAMKISEIAYRWGFNDLSHFNKAFRARFDIAPRDFRNG
jgi:AraC-like DNA-binding protein